MPKKKLSNSAKGNKAEADARDMFQKILKVPSTAIDFKIKASYPIRGYNQDHFGVFDIEINTFDFVTLGIQIKTNSSHTSSKKRVDWAHDVLLANFNPKNAYLILWDFEKKSIIKIWGAYQILKGTK